MVKLATACKWVLDFEWAHGLYRSNGPVAQITRNVLDRLGGHK